MVYNKNTIEQQSRFVRVKCRMNGELSSGRKALRLAVRGPHPAEKTDNISFFGNVWLLKIYGGVFFMSEKFKMSAKNLTTTKGLALAGMLLALHAALGIFKIPFALDNRITLTFAASSAAGIVLGPVPAMLVGGLGDILGYLLNPGGGAYFWGFTISAALGGLIYGVCLYKRSVKYCFWWIMLAVLLITLLVNIMLNTYWLSVMYKKAYQMFALARIIKNMAVYPVHVIVIFALFITADKTGIRKKYL